MENKIHVVSSREMSDIKNNLMKDESLFVAEILGSEVRDLQDFFRIMSELFEFPWPSRNYAGFSDWMTDLDWLHKDGYVLVIHQFQDFMSEDQAEKQEVIDVFATDVLPFWQEEVVKVVVEGEVKLFHVYLVD
jgi:hypothetical protein